MKDKITTRKADVNGDGVKDANDVNTFVNVLLGSEQNTNYMEYADWSGNNDGVPDGRDIQGFVQNYLMS